MALDMKDVFPTPVMPITAIKACCFSEVPLCLVGTLPWSLILRLASLEEACRALILTDNPRESPSICSFGSIGSVQFSPGIREVVRIRRGASFGSWVDYGMSVSSTYRRLSLMPFSSAGRESSFHISNWTISSVAKVCPDRQVPPNVIRVPIVTPSPSLSSQCGGVSSPLDGEQGWSECSIIDLHTG